jgi:outer membrane lipoprotein-sorting protein
MWLGSLWLSLLAAASVVASQPAPAKDLFAQVYERAAATRLSMHSIRAHFTETTVSSLLEQPLVAHGTVIAAPPSRVLMTYTDPERRTILLDSKSLVIVWADRRERETIDISQVQKRIDHYFATASLDQLRSMFDITAQPDRAMRDTNRVDMRPKRKQIKQGLERLELWINRDSLLVQMRMTFPGGDQKTIALDDIAVNVPIGDETFRIRQ